MAAVLLHKRSKKYYTFKTNSFPSLRTSIFLHNSFNTYVTSVANVGKATPAS